MSNGNNDNNHNKDAHDKERASRIKNDEQERSDRVSSNEKERKSRIENDEIERRTRIEGEVFRRLSKPDKKSYIVVALLIIAVMAFFIVIKADVKISPQTAQQIINISNTTAEVQNKTALAVENNTDVLNKSLTALINLINQTIAKNATDINQSSLSVKNTK
jgi:hypothetical protein